MTITLIDGYVDEPTCLGVPPFVSTYVRYAAGAALAAGAADVNYLTIEQLREKSFRLENSPSFAVIVAGNPVPGKYLGGLPVKEEEFAFIAGANPKTRFFLGGPVQFQYENANIPNLKVIRYDMENFIYHYMKDGAGKEELRSPGLLEEFAVLGASVVRKHPRHPGLIAEIETGRGCPRKTHCSFCIEGNYRVEFRKPADVVREMAELARNGIRHFRIGKQADMYAYGSEMKEWKNGFPKPNVERVRELYEGIRAALPPESIRTLHLDNVNPGTIANFPDEAAEITKIIAANNTAGDVAALGMESADPEVIKRNFLKAGPEEVLEAIRIINRYGAARENGIPKLLPGINLIHGLTGENRETFKMNYEFLKRVREEKLLLRRINIRQIRITGNTAIAGEKPPSAKERMKLDAAFRKYREMIRMEVDVPMIRGIFPAGTVLRELIVESNRGDWSIARALGSYSVAVNIPKVLPAGTTLDAFVIGYRERSLVALAMPFELDQASLQELKQIPGLSRKAGEIASHREREIEWLTVSPVFNSIRQYILTSRKKS